MKKCLRTIFAGAGIVAIAAFTASSALANFITTVTHTKTVSDGVCTTGGVGAAPGDTSSLPSAAVYETFLRVGSCHLEFEVHFYVGGELNFVDISIDKFATNNTLRDWTDFHIELMMFDPENPDVFILTNELFFLTNPAPSDPTNHFTLSDSDPRMLWFDGKLPVGEMATFWMGIRVPSLTSDEAGGFLVTRTIVLWQTPTIPEPASLALFGFGLLGLVLARRRRKTT